MPCLCTCRVAVWDNKKKLLLVREKKNHICWRFLQKGLESVSVLLLLLLTNNGIFVSALQVTNGHKVTLHHGNITAVLTRDDGGLSIECHLIVILHRCVLLVGDLEGALGDVEDLARTDG